MASKLIKYTEGLDIDDSLGDGDTSELSLVDDGDDDCSGKLSSLTCQLQIKSTSEEDADNVLYQKGEDGIPHTNPPSYVSYLESQPVASEAVHFEVVKARIVKEKRSKYVVYTMVILRTTQRSESPHAVIERRYSDLERLNSALRKKFPAIMEHIAFPRKVLAGNFEQKVIAQRSRAFEQYLSHINSVTEIRFSNEFADFFYNYDLKLAHAHFREGRYQDSVPLFVSTVTIQDQLLGQHHKEVVSTLCGLVAAYNAMDDSQEACKYALIALRRIGKSENNRFLIPLLQIGIRLCWTLGKDKSDLEERLADLRRRHFPVELAPSLVDLTYSRFPD